MALAIISILVVTLSIITFLLVWGVRKHRKSMSASETRLSDRDLLLLINAEPDRIINAANLAKKSGMSLTQAKTRLHRLMYAGVVSQMTSGFKYFYELKTPIQKEEIIDLSDNPFISIEDLFTLFEHFEYKMTLQDVCLATALPFKVIKKEMKYFQKEGVVHEMTQHTAMGIIANKFYTLQDGFKESQGDLTTRDKEINLDLAKIYRKARRDEDGFV